MRDGALESRDVSCIPIDTAKVPAAPTSASSANIARSKSADQAVADAVGEAAAHHASIGRRSVTRPERLGDVKLVHTRITVDKSPMQFAWNSLLLA